MLITETVCLMRKSIEYPTDSRTHDPAQTRSFRTLKHLFRKIDTFLFITNLKTDTSNFIVFIVFIGDSSANYHRGFIVGYPMCAVNWEVRICQATIDININKVNITLSLVGYSLSSTRLPSCSPESPPPTFPLIFQRWICHFRLQMALALPIYPTRFAKDHRRQTVGSSFSSVDRDTKLLPGAVLTSL